MEKQFHQKPLSNLELSEFCSQISMLIRSGISVPESLQLLMADAQNVDERALLSRMISEADTTGLLYPAANVSGVFPSYALHMIRLGEETGTLDNVLEALANHYIREENIRSMTKSALLYPGIMLCMMFLIVLTLLTRVMPVFQQVFVQLGHEMTGFSAALLKIGESLSRYSLAFIIATGLLILLTAFFYKHLPFVKRFQDKISACRFSDGMSIALKSGMTPEQSLDLVRNLIDNQEFQDKIILCEKMLSEGIEFPEALTKADILTGSYARVAHIAGKTGQMDEAMKRISDEYEYSINTRIAGLLSMLEPTLVIILSLIVGVILFSVMMPLLGILSGL